MDNLIEETQIRLHAQGGRMTPQRRLIMETLNEMDSHPTAEEIFNLAREKDSSLHLSTVYRTMRWLEQEGLVHSRFFEDGQRQERFDAAPEKEHYHFVCNECKRIIEFDTLLVNAIKAQFELHTGAQVEVGTVVLYGQCASCREKSQNAE